MTLAGFGRRLFLAAAAAVVAGVAVPAFAQNGTIKGRIVDQTGKPIAGVSVQIEMPADPSVPAVKAGRIAIITDERVVVPGPRVAEGTELIARALHPEAFAK